MATSDWLLEEDAWDVIFLASWKDECSLHGWLDSATDIWLPANIFYLKSNKTCLCCVIVIEILRKYLDSTW